MQDRTSPIRHSILLCTLSAAVVGFMTQAASAASLHSITNVAGTTRNASTLFGSYSSSNIMQLRANIRYTDGTSSLGVAPVMSGSIARFETNDVRIEITQLNPTTDELRCVRKNTTRDVQSIQFVQATLGVGFDRTNPNEGTVGSGSGRDPVIMAGSTGLWLAQVTYRDAIRRGTAGSPVGDLYASLEIYFHLGLRRADVCVMQLDLDRAV
jgi:hypothetical protein